MTFAVPSVLALLLPLTLAPIADPADTADTARATSLQQRVDAVLEEFPGGEQIGPNAISWEDGAIVLELADSSIAARAISTCATGSYCAWSYANYGGNKLSFTTCTSGGTIDVSLGTLGGTAKSLANARGSGTVTVLNALNSTVYSVPAGVGVPSYGLAASKLRCFS